MNFKVGDWVMIKGDEDPPKTPDGSIGEITTIFNHRQIDVRLPFIPLGAGICSPYHDSWVFNMQKLTLVDKEEILLQIGSVSDTYDFSPLVEWGKKFIILGGDLRFPYDGETWNI